MVGCNSTKTVITNENIITKSCALNGLLNDTIVIDGVYSTCMEYSSFQTIKKDDCFSEYKMELNLSEKHIKTSIRKKVYDMVACNASRRMVVKGIVSKDKLNYGHLGTNNAEITVIEIIRLDDIKHRKIKK
jgi:hypothetical protein